jgi:hypothetical protein
VYRFGGIIILIFIVLVGGASVSQDLSQVVLPSEDELLDALRAGDISYEQYAHLREILSNGVDSSALYLLDDIPNLVYFGELMDSIPTLLETEQRRSVLRGSSRGVVSHRYLALLEREERHWYRTAVDIRIAQKYRLLLKVSRETGGAERVTDRSLSYANPRGLCRRLTIGSFTTRLGLGTAFGYRGKLLDFPDRLNSESILMPDQGGYNGVLTELTTGSLKLNGLVSFVRDSQYRIASVGFSLSRVHRSLRPGIVLGYNQLTNRTSNAAVHLPVLGAFQEYRYRQGYVAAELTFQAGAGRTSEAAVIEGRHNVSHADIRYAAWVYDDKLVELNTGSKAASLTHSDTVAAVDFTYTTKRAGQKGFLMKTAAKLTERLTLSSGLVSAERSSSDALRQVSGGLDQRLGARWRIDLEYLHKWRRHLTESAATNRASHRVSLGARFTAGVLSARSYIGLGAEKGYRGFMSWFTDMRFKLDNNGEIQVWSNLGRLSAHRVEHWYVFLRASQNLTYRLTGAAKLAHTYRRSAEDRYQMTLSFELAAML